MIRDPSDGSVRNPHGESPLSREVVPTREPRAPISGLSAGSTKPENIARLEKSREWLRDYLAKKSEVMEQGEENGDSNIGQAHHDH